LINPAANDSVIVLSIDRLSAAALGAYGNTSIETSELNRWAAAGVLFDQVIAGSIDLQEAYDAQWVAGDAELDSPVEKAISETHSALLATLTAAGWASTLVTDEPKLIEPAERSGFDEVLQIESVDSDVAAETAADTQLANFFIHASEALSRVQPRSITWLHSRGMSGLWDAPIEYRTALAAPDDPPPPTFVQPPNEWNEIASVDPDRLLGFEQAYAAQVSLLDQLLDAWSDQLNNDARFTDTWIVFTSVRGYPLGQHGVVGEGIDPDFSGSALHQDSLHVPLVVCPPARLADRFAATRCGHLVQDDWLPLFLRQLALGDGEQALQSRLDQIEDPQAVVISQAGAATAVQTPTWKLITAAGQDRLYVKPDDVSDRCPTELAEMKQRLQ
jgi:arylsulfatase A-like enzyme